MSVLSTSIPELVTASIERAGLENAGILVALSGGLDSVCLLRLVARLLPEVGGRAEVMHVDHGLRPDSADDARFCRDLAQHLGLPFHLRRLRAEEMRGRRGTQAEARRVRRGLFEEVRAGRGLDAVALGHHQDDQVETVLFRLLRGAGPRGLAGMTEWAPPYFRPLLAVGRADLEALARQERWPHREDPSNRTARYSRNRLRREALPLLRSIHPGTDESLLRLARLLREEDELLSGEAAAALTRLGTREPEGLRFDAGAVRSLPGPIRRRVYLAAWESLGLDPADLEARHLQVVDQLLEPGRAHRRAAIPGPGVVAASYDQIWFLQPGSLERRPAAVCLPEPGSARVPGLGVTACWGKEPPPGVSAVSLPPGREGTGISLRTWEPGDRVPVGVDRNGRAARRHKVKDLFMEARVPAWRRLRALVVVAGRAPLGLLADGRAWGGAASADGWVWLEEGPGAQDAAQARKPAENRCCPSDRCDT